MAQIHAYVTVVWSWTCPFCEWRTTIRRSRTDETTGRMQLANSAWAHFEVKHNGLAPKPERSQLEAQMSPDRGHGFYVE